MFIMFIIFIHFLVAQDAVYFDGGVLGHDLHFPSISKRVACADSEGIWFGEIIQFNDDDFTLTVKRDDNNQEFIVRFDDLFRGSSEDFGWGDSRRFR